MLKVEKGYESMFANKNGKFEIKTVIGKKLRIKGEIGGEGNTGSSGLLCSNPKNE